jgi:hypothetical protein
MVDVFPWTPTTSLFRADQSRSPERMVRRMGTRMANA